MFNLLTQSYWRDEAFSVMLASRPLKEIFGLIVRFDHTPPLFVYFQRIWIYLFGDGEVAMRSLSILFYLLAVYFVYKLTKNRLAGVALALNPFMWQYALEARHYTAYTALVLGAVYFYQVKKLVWTNVFWILALWTHNFAWLYFFVFFLLTRNKRLLPSAAIGAIWLPFAWRQIQSLGREMWLSAPTGPWWWLESFRVFFPAGTVLAAALLILALLKPKRILALALIPPLLTYLISHLWTPLYLERYLLPTLALLVAFIGRKRRLRPFMAVYVLVSVLAFWQINQQTTKPPMRQTVARIVKGLKPGDIVITEQPINYLEVYYYLKQSGKENLLYSYLYPGEDVIPDYVGTDLIKPWQEIVAVPPGRPFWLIKPDAAVVRYE